MAVIIASHMSRNPPNVITWCAAIDDIASMSSIPMGGVISPDERTDHHQPTAARRRRVAVIASADGSRRRCAWVAPASMENTVTLGRNGASSSLRT
jgi:hypothetical protein